jgi:hypothetical protein
MNLDVLILNSGEWVLGEELSAAPWCVLVYRQRGNPGNELHLWLPREEARRSGEFAFRRYWTDRSVRWCVEMAEDVRQSPLVRFTSPEGRVLTAQHHGARGLGDLSDQELGSLLVRASETSMAGL